MQHERMITLYLPFEGAFVAKAELLKPSVDLMVLFTVGTFVEKTLVRALFDVFSGNVVLGYLLEGFVGPMLAGYDH